MRKESIVEEGDGRRQGKNTFSVCHGSHLDPDKPSLKKGIITKTISKVEGKSSVEKKGSSQVVGARGPNCNGK